MIRTLTLAALAAVLAAPMARAQAPSTASRAAVNDSLFAEAAAIGGMAEITLSELGAQRATDPELKKFSQQMIDAHSRMNRELITLASQKRIPQSLAGLSGEEFDHCYAKAQLVAHMDSVAAFEAEAERGIDPNMKALAAKALPHIKEHLKTIKPIAMKYEKEKPSTAGASSEAQPK
jgi:putative membrane protein